MSSERITINDLKYDVLTYKPTTSELKETLTVFMVPGNPGLINYYTDFLGNLHKNLNEEVEVCGVSHTGHSLSNHTNELVSLEEQIKHKVDFIKWKIEQNEKARFILIGHSVGAYICLKMLHDLPAEKIDGVYGLYPTIQYIGSSKKGKMLMPLFSLRLLVSVIAGLLACIPKFIRNMLISTYFTEDEKTACSVTQNELLSYKTVYNILHMAKIEMDSILEADHDCLMRHGDKVTLYYAPNDNWVTEEHGYDYMNEKYKHIKSYLCTESTKHNFCCFESQSSVMAGKTTEWVRGSWSL